jgi:predicted aspartyl protease
LIYGRKLQLLDRLAAAFTSRSNGGILRELRNDIHISDAFDPGSTVQPPPASQYSCLWDTGATNTVITKRVVDELRLAPSGKQTVRTVGAANTFNEYEESTYVVNLILPNKVLIAGVPVSEASIAGADALIGMDIIGMGDFAITNYNGKTVWSFRWPSADLIDFIPSTDEHNRRWQIKQSGAKGRKKRRMERNR